MASSRLIYFFKYLTYIALKISEMTLREVKQTNIMVCQSLRGREAPPEGYHGKKSKLQTIETPSLPFETETLKIRRPLTSLRSSKSLSRSKNLHKIRKKNESIYAIRFSDSTWATTDDGVHDHYANRAEIIEVINKFDSAIRSITGNDEIERASALQCFTDILLDELSNQLRAECREQTLIVERARETYAAIFALHQEDRKKCREMIEKLRKHNIKLEEDLTKVIDTSSERVAEVQEDYKRKIQEKNEEVELKKAEYDTSVMRFLEQKEQLEEHVKALHRVFLDFQSDSVYISLEDIKQKQSLMEKKLKAKESEIDKLNEQVQMLTKQIQEVQTQKDMLEQANDELNTKLQSSLVAISRLENQLEIKNFEENNGETLDKSDLSSNQNDGDSGQRAKNGPKLQTQDSSHIINIIDKLNRLDDNISDFISNTGNKDNISSGSADDNIENIVLSGNISMILGAIESKIDEVVRNSELLHPEEINMSKQVSKVDRRPRFLRYLDSHVSTDTEENIDESGGINIFAEIRKIFQAKYIQDAWEKRLGTQVMRMPEFLITYYSKDGESLFVALQKCRRLYNLIQEKMDIPEIKLFSDFLLESHSADEMCFFLECGYSLLGLPEIKEDASDIVKVPFERCLELMERLIGKFSPVFRPLVEKAEKLIKQDRQIDYASFMTVLLDYYEKERGKRTNAVRMMFTSTEFSKKKNGESLDFESFCAMVESLGYKGPNTVVFELYREASLYGHGELTIEGLFAAMDSIGFHFYTIECPISELTYQPVCDISKQKILTHFLRFDSWFEGFRRPLGTFDQWVKAQITSLVKNVDEAFKRNLPVSMMYTEYRKLLDFMQFSLSALAHGRGVAMSADKSERQLLLLENLVDLLVTFVVTEPDKDFPFEELKE